MSAEADKVSGEILEDKIVEPGGYCAREVRKGEVFRIVDIEGQQVMDFLAFNLNDRTYPPAGCKGEGEQEGVRRCRVLTPQASILIFLTIRFAEAIQAWSIDRKFGTQMGKFTRVDHQPCLPPESSLDRKAALKIFHRPVEGNPADIFIDRHGLLEGGHDTLFAIGQFTNAARDANGYTRLDIFEVHAVRID